MSKFLSISYCCTYRYSGFSFLNLFLTKSFPYYYASSKIRFNLNTRAESNFQPMVNRTHTEFRSKEEKKFYQHRFENVGHAGGYYLTFIGYIQTTVNPSRLNPVEFIWEHLEI